MEEKSYLHEDADESGPENLPIPKVSIRVWVDPPVYSLSNTEPPSLTISITSHAARPITVLSWRNIIDTDRVFSSKTLEIFDLDAQQRMWHPHSRSRRGAFRRGFGVSDEKYFTTFLPEVPLVGTTSLYPARSWLRKGADDPVAYTPKYHPSREEYRKYLEPGHKFQIRFAHAVCGFRWWRWGLKEEVLAPIGASAADRGLGWSEPLLALDYPELAEFTLEA